MHPSFDSSIHASVEVEQKHNSRALHTSYGKPFDNQLNNLRLALHFVSYMLIPNDIILCHVFRQWLTEQYRTVRNIDRCVSWWLGWRDCTPHARAVATGEGELAESRWLYRRRVIQDYTLRPSLAFGLYIALGDFHGIFDMVIVNMFVVDAGLLSVQRVCKLSWVMRT